MGDYLSTRSKNFPYSVSFTFAIIFSRWRSLYFSFVFRSGEGGGCSTELERWDINRLVIHSVSVAIRFQKRVEKEWFDNSIKRNRFHKLEEKEEEENRSYQWWLKTSTRRRSTTLVLVDKERGDVSVSSRNLFAWCRLWKEKRKKKRK